MRILLTSPRPFAIAYHFFGRSILCAGSHCPACAYRTPKYLYYFSAVSQREERVFEACPSFVECIYEAQKAAHAPDWSGVIVDATRSGLRSPWRMKQSGYRPDLAPPFNPMICPRKIAALFRVAPPKIDDDPVAWLDRVAQGQKEVLRRCVIE